MTYETLDSLKQWNNGSCDNHESGKQIYDLSYIDRTIVGVALNGSVVEIRYNDLKLDDILRKMNDINFSRMSCEWAPSHVNATYSEVVV